VFRKIRKKKSIETLRKKWEKHQIRVKKRGVKGTGGPKERTKKKGKRA